MKLPVGRAIDIVGACLRTFHLFAAGPYNKASVSSAEHVETKKRFGMMRPYSSFDHESEYEIIRY